MSNTTHLTTTGDNPPSGYILVSNGTGGTNWIEPPKFNYGLFSQIEEGEIVTGDTEQSIIGNGVGTLTVPSNSFQIGDSFTCTLDGTLSCLNSATLHIHVKTLDGVILCDTGVIDMDVSGDKPWSLIINFTIRKLGGEEIASISSGGLFSYIKDSGTNFEGYVLGTINDTTFDTTIENTLDITAQWNTASTENQIQSQNFVLRKTY